MLSKQTTLSWAFHYVINRVQGQNKKMSSGGLSILGL